MAQTEATITGTKPAQLVLHTMGKDYVITGITSKDFTDMHTGAEFDFTELQKTFKQHCNDYGDDLVENVPSKALEFCSKVIYEVGPESRKVKKGTGDKVWKFIFGTGKDAHIVYVATFKSENALYNPEASTHHMVLTIKQAGLLAIMTFGHAVAYAYLTHAKVLFTPLAGACFSKEDLVAFANSLNINVETLIIKINASCQSGGHYVPVSDPNIAIVSAIAATRNVKEDSLRQSIVMKLVKQYINVGKMPDKDLLRRCAPFATGGVPTEFSFDELIKLYDTEQNNYNLMKRAKLIKESTIKSRIEVPLTMPLSQFSGHDDAAGGARRKE
ncbi:MAG: nucleoprotein [hymenopteran phasma-related virus OKIAV227]|uniref:nucleoprotein n=1 Tax=hymenopteran phasma-related virus OKIAV227 TaxID=2847799 RepID=UPI00248386D3|nr:MAG: nucleoprotein [hymenopteran phasma-related virus OKIAV227]WBM84617.1 MAG: nucleoprotein [hymenopteran phasma-related virus OKIAV227]